MPPGSPNTSTTVSVDHTPMDNNSLSRKPEPGEHTIDKFLDDKPPDTGQREDYPSTLRRYFLLLLFCLAQFMDAFNGSAFFTAIPTLVEDLGFSASESPWIVSAYQLTFASFLLISGRISDIFYPKYVLVFGITALGALCIGLGFVRDEITFLVLRGLSGVCASLTIPSSLTLLVNLFPEPTEQARAIGVFGGCACLGNVLGLVIGAIFVEYAGWSWIFYFIAIVTISIGGICLMAVPKPVAKANDHLDSRWWKRFDAVGVVILTAGLLLFIFALTSSSTSGWGSARVLAPLIISVFMIAGFFAYERIIPADTACVPPHVWFYPNFAVLMCFAVIPSLWWTIVGFSFPTLWQDIYRWPVISVAVHLIPVGIVSGLVSFSGPLATKFSLRYFLLGGQALLVISCVLLALGNTRDKYWSYTFPGFILGAAGAMLAYTQSNVGVFAASPPSMAGTVGAMFNCLLQLGASVGVAAASSIITSVDSKSSDPDTYAGRAAAWWFVLGIVGVETIIFQLFYKPKPRELEEGQSGSTSCEVPMSSTRGRGQDVEWGDCALPDKDDSREGTVEY